MRRPMDLTARGQHLCAGLSDAGLPAVARTLALLGLPVIPIHAVPDTGQCSCGSDCGRNAGKPPRTSNGLLNATTDSDQIGAWRQRWPDANIAVATGAVAGIWVLDIDPDNGGEATLA